jgi:fatty-acyl-CoA synthase
MVSADSAPDPGSAPWIDLGGPANLGLGSWPARRARMAPERLALSQGGRQMTYLELAARSAALATVLQQSGVQPGDRVAYLGQNAIETFETFFACGLAGAVFVPLNYRLAAAELSYMLGDCGPVVLVHSQDTDPLVRQLLPLPAVRRVLAVHPETCPAGGDDYAGLVAAAAPAEPVRSSLDDPALILYTSGTTGRPKGAVLTHGNLTWNTVNQLAHVDVLSTDRALCIAPLFHVVGLGQITLPTLFKGGSVEVVPSFSADRILGLIKEQAITSFSAVPTMLQMMCESPAWESADLSSLTCVIYGGSPVQERVARAWLSRGVQLRQGFGMTEAAPGVCMALPEGSLERPVSVGVPHFFTDMAHLARAAPVPMAAEVSAELLVRGPNIFSRYWQRESETAESFVGDWFRTGDVVRAGADGWAYVVDRVKDMIISGGENIYPAEVEAVLVQLDEIAAAAVVGIPDERWGETGAAFVQLRPGAQLTEQRVRAHLEANLARYKVPRTITFVADLPRTASGKIQRAHLREQATVPDTNQDTP